MHTTPSLTLQAGGRLILRKDMPALTGYSIVHIYRLMKAQQFPKPVRLGENRVAWLESELLQWRNSKIAAREASGGGAA